MDLVRFRKVLPFLHSVSSGSIKAVLAHTAVYLIRVDSCLSFLETGSNCATSKRDGAL